MAPRLFKQLSLLRKIFLVVLFCEGIRTMEDCKDTRNGLQKKLKPSIRKLKTLQVWQ